MQEQLRLLVELQGADQKLSETEALLAEIPAKLKSMQDDVGQVEALLQRERQQLEEAQTYKRALDQQIAVDQEQVGKAKTKLTQIRNTKEYAALQREVETNRRLVGEREEEALKLMEAIDACEASIRAHEADMEALRQVLREEQAEANARLAELASAVAAARAARAEKVAHIPVSIARKYDNIRKSRSGLAVVVAQSGICLGCRMHLPPQLYNILQRSASIEQCPNCQRIVYYLSEETADTLTA